jgi:hypothetical protein
MNGKNGRIIKMRLKRLAMIAIYSIGLPLLLLFSFVSEASAFDEPDLLSRQIRATAIKAESIDQVLDLLAADYRIPIGIELGDPKLTPYREIDLNLPETNLKGFLDSVIAKDPRYTWKLEGSVIHVWPVTARDSFVATLLDTKISHFVMIGETRRHRIFNDIMNLPEIGSRLAIANIAPLIFVNFGSMHKLEKGTFFSESNLTLRELLDRIIVKTDIKRWVLVRWGKNSEFITLRS